MATERRRTRSRKVQPTSGTDAPGLKQKTLFDSFTSRSGSKAAPIEVPVVATDELPQPPGGTGTPPVEVESNQDSNKPSVEVLEISDSSPPTATTALVNDETNRKRSPSVITIESSPEFVSVSLPSTTASGFTTLDVTADSKSTPRNEGRSKDAPIIIASSPIRAGGSSMRPDKPLHPFFATNKKNKEASPSPGPTAYLLNSARSKKALGANGNELPAFPDRFSQHIRGPQTVVTPALPVLPSRRPVQTDLTFDNDSGSGHSYSFLKRAYTSHFLSQSSHTVYLAPSTASGDPLLDAIPSHIRSQHPAISHLANLKPEDKPISRRPWTDKWRPSAAQEVLGNERSAIYLRDWLRALEVQWEVKEPPKPVEIQPPSQGSQKGGKGKVKGKEKAKAKGKEKAESKTRGTKRPRVVRAVDKSRKKRAGMDWILESDEDEEDDYEDPPWLDDGFDEFGEIIAVPAVEPPPSSPGSSIPGTQEWEAPDWEERPPDLGQLHNTILLAGPSGSGKTACVYACAEELGWDVFEVYPGIGRRNGANIDDLVGEVGKNHLVLQNRTPGDALRSFLKSKGKRKNGDNGGSVEPESLAQFSPRKKSSVALDARDAQGDVLSPGDDDTGTQAVRQSLILLEEVDILFKEDTNFWSTVTKIIQECKRPVICTCNDVSLVPTSDLPLQSTLFFEPPSNEVASYYLQALCSVEGFAVDLEQIGVLYSNPISRDPRRLEEIFLEPRVADLRGTINTLQFLSAYSSTPTSARSLGIEVGNDLNSNSLSLNLLQQSELHSYVDSHLVRSVSTTYSVADDFVDWGSSRDDDETGHSILYDQHAPTFVPFEVYDRHVDMILAVHEITRGRGIKLNISQEASEIHNCEEERRRIHQEQVIAMQEFRRKEIWCRPDASVSLEFGPYVRQMVESDDREAEEKRERQMHMPGSRRTNNSNKMEHVRIFQLSDAARRGLGCGGL